ncbi:MAG: hypothetical protein ACRYFS_17890 [Janthinobacterium lividum]
MIFFRCCPVLPLCLALLLLPLAVRSQTSLSSPATPSAQPLPLPINVPLPPPTDQPPPEVPLPNPIPLGKELLVSGALDIRTRTADAGRTGGVWVNTVELDLQHPISSKGQTRGNLYVQLIAENPPDQAHSDDVQIGEAYFIYRLPVENDFDSTAYLKVGQFQLPFGLLAVYDPHLLILQPLYSQSLGLRTDFGISVSGRVYGFLNYDLALTTGTGPNHLYANPNRVVTFRLGRTFTTRNGVVNVGGSLLQGRLPITDITADDPFAVELPPSGRVHADRGGYVSKSRLGGDASYGYRRVVARGEVVAGADNDQRVLGYYAEGNYSFTERMSVVAARSLFVYPEGNSTASQEAVGLTYAPSANLTFRTLYQYLRDVPRDSSAGIRHRLTFQVLLRF